MEMLNMIQGRLVEIETEMTTLQAAADEAGRTFTADEKSKLVALTKEHDELKTDLDLRQKVAAAKGATAVPAPKASGLVAAAPARQLITGGSPWRTIGHYAMDVRAAAHNPDIRQRLMNAAAIFSSEGVDADGGYAVPDDLRRDIQSKFVGGQDDLLSRCDVQRSFSTTMAFPRDTEEDWGLTSISATVVAEGQDYSESSVGLGSITVNSAKVGVIINATEELVNDALSFTTYIQSKGARKLKHKVNDYLINGATGSNTPHGILNHASLLTVATGSENATDKLSGDNVTNMYYAMPQALRGNAVWLVSDSVEPKLPTLKFSGSTLYSAPGTLANPIDIGKLYGRPVIVMPQMKALGTKGDIAFVDWSQYLAFVKSDLQTSFNPYLYWKSDTLSWKLYVRLGGRPWIDAPITMGDGTTKRSAFVALAAR